LQDTSTDAFQKYLAVKTQMELDGIWPIIVAALHKQRFICPKAFVIGCHTWSHGSCRVCTIWPYLKCRDCKGGWNGIIQINRVRFFRQCTFCSLFSICCWINGNASRSGWCRGGFTCIGRYP
jgi:hypothetical protein